MNHRQPLARLLVALLIVVVVFFIFAEKEEEGNSKASVYEKYLEEVVQPNQTLWQKLVETPPEQINLTAPSVSPKAKVLIIVPLEPHMDRRRREIRTIWANPENSQVIKDGLVSVLFVVNHNVFTDALIEEENDQHKDILVVRGQESYKGLVYKLLLAFRWISSYHPDLHVAKIDSDVVVSVDRLYGRIIDEKDKLFASGFLWKKTKPHRDPFDQWFIPKSAWPLEVLPTYVNGPLYVLSSSALKAVLSEAPKHPIVEVEDIFFTGILAEAAGVGRHRMEGLYYQIPNEQPCDEKARPTVVAYPVHDMKVGLKIAYKQMKAIPCKKPFRKKFFFSAS